MRTRQDLGPLQNEVSIHVCVCMHMYVTMFISRMEANIPLGQRQTSTGVITGEFKIVFPSYFLPSIVMYAPLIGTMGLDLCRRFSREELALMKSVLLNSPLPFHLELCGYVNQAASSLFFLTDDNILLECNEQTGFTVTGNVASLSYTYNFFLPIVVKCYCSVVHQSETRVSFTPPSTAIFCIASSHSCAFEYDWTCEADPTGVSSPVIYAARPGVYQCEVTSDTGNKCTSLNI